MGLESATFIEDLVETNPLGTDGKAQGDNHIRLIKGVLQNQFPNLGSAAVTATAAEINDIVDNNRAVPSGLISLWSGTIAAIPTGWLICDGTNGTPNLVSRFIVGSASDTGATYDIGDTGGSADIALSATDSHVLSVAEMPSHTHDVTTKGGGGIGTNIENSSGAEAATTTLSGALATGGGGGHTHDISVSSDVNIPPFFALAYIQKA